jgi:hypothetical protein
MAVAAQRMRGTDLQLRSVVLFFALLSAFIALLVLRTRILVAPDSNTVAAPSAAHPSTFAAKTVSVRPDF